MNLHRRPRDVTSKKFPPVIHQSTRTAVIQSNVLILKYMVISGLTEYKIRDFVLYQDVTVMRVYIQLH